MGRAFVAGNRSQAVTWYNNVRFETRSGHLGGQNIPITQVHTINNITLLDLLISINQFAQPGETIVTVHHGNPQGFSFPLATGTNVYGTAQAMRDLMGTIPSDQLGIPNVSPQQVDQFRTLIAAIRAKQLAGVEIRSCNMGDLSILEVIRGFFGCQYAAAPIIRDFFIAIPTVSVRTQVQLQTLAAQPSCRCWPDFCVSFQPAGGGDYRIIISTVQDTGPRARWMQANFAAGNAFQPPQSWLAGAFVVHGVVLTNVLRLPVETEYRNNIQIYPGSV